MSPKQLTTEEESQLYIFASKYEDTGNSKFSGMSYEDGVRAVLDVMNGYASIEDITGENE